MPSPPWERGHGMRGGRLTSSAIITAEGPGYAAVSEHGGAHVAEQARHGDASLAGGARAEFLSMFSLYALWTGLAWFSVAVGRTELADQGATVLLVGAAATNAMFLVVARSNAVHRPPERTIALAQCVMAVTWATLFSFLSSGSAMLTFGMYFSTIIFALSRVGRIAFAHLGMFATGSYAGVVAVKMALTGTLTLDAEGFGILVFGGVVGWYLVAGQRATATDGPRTSLAHGAAAAGLAKIRSRQRSMLDMLAREKGRADRTNYPFSICVFDVDDLRGLVNQHGADATRHVLRRLEKRARGELPRDGRYQSRCRTPARRSVRYRAVHRDPAADQPRRRRALRRTHSFGGSRAPDRRPIPGHDIGRCGRAPPR